jgi:molybdopterin molybdotransferase
MSFVEHVLEKAQGEKNISQHFAEPGRPMFFGTFKNKLVFALPGNPASVMVLFL